MNRRTFMKMLPGVIYVGGGLRLLMALKLNRYTRADISMRYPGKIKRLNKARINRIAPWSG